MTEPAPFNPAAARLDDVTEAELYDLYRAYFAAHEARQWNVWEVIPTTTIYEDEPSAKLIAAAIVCYGAELFLPDYMTTLLMHTRSSRGRTWYVTHWCYEEGKHLLAIGEWLLRRGLYTEADLQNRGSEMLEGNRWHPASIDAVALYADAVLYEAQEQTNYQTLRDIAASENDTVLTTLCDYVLGDERAQQAYFVEALRIIAKRNADVVESAVQTICAPQPNPEVARQIINGLLEAH